MGEFDDIIPEYLAESQELLETVESGFLALESGEADDETVHTVFRAIHSIKGGAGFVGLGKIERLAHKMEDLLNLVRNHDLAPTPPVTDSLLQSLDVLTALFEQPDNQEGIDIEGPLRALAAALEAGVDTGLREQVRPREYCPNPSGIPSFDVTAYTLRNKLSHGNVFYLRLDLSQIEARGLTPMQLVSEMLSMGEILDSDVDLPTLGDETTYEVATLQFHVLYATVLEADLLTAAFNLNPDSCRQLGPDDLGLDDQIKGLTEPVCEAGPEPAPAQAAKPAPAAPAKPPEPQRRQTEPAEKRPAAGPKPAPPAPAPTAQPAALAVVEAAPAKGRGGEYLTFTLGRETYGVDILCVQEIIGLPRLTRLPRASDYVLGVMNLRGMVVPVLDLRRKLGLDQDPDAEPVAVVLKVEDKIMSAVVDSVSDVVQVGEDQVQDAPEFAGPVRRDYVLGLCRHEQAMIILLELDRLLLPEALGNVA